MTRSGTAERGAKVITFLVPLPPAALRGNSRAGWAERKRAADAYSEEVWWTVTGVEAKVTVLVAPWRRAAVTYTWRYAGARPDIDNIARGIKVLQDTLCVAPAAAVVPGAYQRRCFLGIVEDDGDIEPVTFLRRKVQARREEGVYVRIEGVRA